MFCCVVKRQQKIFFCRAEVNISEKLLPFSKYFLFTFSLISTFLKKCFNVNKPKIMNIRHILFLDRLLERRNNE